MSALFQTLFMNLSFRERLYQYIPASFASLSAASDHNIPSSSSSSYSFPSLSSSDPDLIVIRLQQLFTSLQTSARKAVDPAHIVSALELDKFEQQDVSEFNGLFLQKLSERLHTYEANPAVQNLVEDEFQGELQHQLTCKGTCGRPSAFRTNAFVELMLPVKGTKSVMEALEKNVLKDGKKRKRKKPTTPHSQKLLPRTFLVCLCS
jgi:hypothetical protein